MQRSERVTLLRNLLAVAGVASIVAGVALWSAPAACVVAGAICVLYVYITTK